jgi:hypothetical protein
MTAAERAAVLELARKLHVELDMVIPDGKTCGDCQHLRRCTALIGARPGNRACDWSPHRFTQAILEAKDSDG